MRFVAAAAAAPGPAAALPPQKMPPNAAAGGAPWVRMGVEGLKLCGWARTEMGEQKSNH